MCQIDSSIHLSGVRFKGGSQKNGTALETL